MTRLTDIDSQDPVLDSFHDDVIEAGHGSERHQQMDGTTCPTCGRDDFESKRSMKAHHAMIHDESIAGETRGCDWCGSAVTRPPSGFVNQRTGEPYDHVFCSKECEGAWASENATGNLAGGWDGGLIEVVCDYCGETNPVKQNQAKKNGRNFCDLDCMGMWISEHRTGENHPNWNGGGNGSYGEGWARCRRRARERDGYQCQRCGTHERGLEQELSVHHVVPVDEFDDIADAHYLSNVVSLCQPCHRKMHSDSFVLNNPGKLILPESPLMKEVGV